MAEKQVLQFQHVIWSIKDIPGVKNHVDLSPKVRTVAVTTPEGRVAHNFELDPSHVVTVALLDEDPDIDLPDRLKKLPEAVKERLLQSRADEYLGRVRANDTVRSRIQHLHDTGSIKITYDGPLSAAKIKELGAVQVDLSAIALADHIDRGIPIPDYAQKNAVDVRAAEKARATIESTVKANDLKNAPEPSAETK